MPAEQEHQSAYDRHHLSYCDTVDGHPDWAAVMLFYCAVHQVERLLAIDNLHSSEHADREWEVKTRYMSLWSNYRALKSESLKTRYLQGGLFQMSSVKVKQKLMDERLKMIIEDIEGRIKARTLGIAIKPK